MKLSIKHKAYLEYFMVFAIWLLIFGKNALSQMLFVDYVPSTFIDLSKTLFTSNFTHVINFFDILKIILIPLNLGGIAFQFSILIAMLFSYYYIKKLIKTMPLLFALIFFFNPFVYSRIMVGQLGVILSYLMLPVFIFYLFSLFQTSFSYKSAIKLAIALTLVSMFQIQFFALALLLFFTVLLLSVFSKSRKFTLKDYSKITLVFLLAVFLFNAYWLQGFLSNSIFSQIDASHESFFSPKPTQGISAVSKIIGMWGFWREASYITPYKDITIYLWYFMLVIIVFLLIWGYYNDSDRLRSKFFLIIWWIGVLLAVGISHPYTKPFFDFLFNNLPFFNGFRDSHKFIALTAMAYAYFIPIGINYLREKIELSRLLRALIVLIPAIFIIAYTFPLVNLSGQIHHISYPEDYYKASEFLKEKQGEIIYLPWQTYLTYSWSLGASSDGRISVPINQIAKNNILIGPDQYGSAGGLTSSITGCISNKDINCFKISNIQYIIKDSCAVYIDDYSWLNQSSASSVYSGDCLEIYKITDYPPQSKAQIPSRFLFGVEISIIAFAIASVLLVSKKFRKKQG